MKSKMIASAACMSGLLATGNKATMAMAKAIRKKLRSRFRPVGSGERMPLAPRFRITDMPIRNSDRVESMSGAPRIAPMPISWSSSARPVPAKKASSGTMLSGMAVPTAANSEPVTPSEIPSRSPRCSRALVKTSAAIRMTSSITSSSPASAIIFVCSSREISADRSWALRNG